MPATPKRYRLSVTRVRDGVESAGTTVAMTFCHMFSTAAFHVLLSGMPREVVNGAGEVFRLERKEIES